MTRKLPSWHLDEPRLLDLVHGLVAPAAAAEAFAHLRDCGDCELRFRLLARDRDEILSAPRPHWVDGRIAWSGTSASTQDEKVPIRAAWRRPWVPLAAAAVLVLVLVLPRVTFRSGGVPAASTPVHLLPQGQEFVRQRASTTETSKALVDARDAYDRGDFAEVVALLEIEADLNARTARNPPASPAWARDPMRRLYLASAYIQLEGWQAARDLLADQDIHLWPQPSRREAQWVLYVALLRTGDARGAEAVRRELASQPNAIGALARAARAP